jgi:carbon-monoxide dehydrogenase catalytic subunit
MDFVQKKTADSAVEAFLPKAAEMGVSLVWDRYEGSLPQCGFCETGLNCRDCLQGPCISHPFRDQNKVGICGKDKDLLGVHSLLRLVLHGAMAYLDQLTDFAGGVKSGEGSAKNKGQTDRLIKDIQAFLADGGAGVEKEFPKGLIDGWKAKGLLPEGIARDLFKVSQKLDGGTSNIEDTLLWAFKAALSGCLAQVLQGRLKLAVFGDSSPKDVEVNLGVLQKGVPTILLCGHFSPLLKQRIAEGAKGENIRIVGVCTDPLLPPYVFAPATNYGSQEIPIMTGAVDLLVAGDQCVNPSLAELAKQWKVEVVQTEGLNGGRDLGSFAKRIVEQVQRAFDGRRKVTSDIPDTKETALMGFSAEGLDAKKITEAIKGGKIKGLALVAGCNNVKFTQDLEIVSLARELLKRDVFCVSEGCASISLAKYGLLNPRNRESTCGEGLSDLLSSLGKGLPPVVDLGSCENGGVTEFLLALGKVPKELPLVACFPEANRTKAVARAAWTVAMGVPTYFWPYLPVTGSPKTVGALGDFCQKTFGAKLNVVTEKMEPAEKADLLMKDLKRA